MRTQHIRDISLTFLSSPFARNCRFDPPAAWKPCNFGRSWQAGSGQSNMPFLSNSIPWICVRFPLDAHSNALVNAWEKEIGGRMASKDRLYELWMLYYTKVSHCDGTCWMFSCHKLAPLMPHHSCKYSLSKSVVIFGHSLWKQFQEVRLGLFWEGRTWSAQFIFDQCCCVIGNWADMIFI